MSAVFSRRLPRPTSLWSVKIQSAGAKCRHKGAVTGTEAGSYPKTYAQAIHTGHTQSIFQSHDHQRGDVWLARRRKNKKGNACKASGQETSSNMIQAFTFDSRRSFTLNCLLAEKQWSETYSTQTLCSELHHSIVLHTFKIHEIYVINCL